MASILQFSTISNIEKTAAGSLDKSCGHTIYWGLGGRYEIGDISNKAVANPDCIYLLKLSKNPKSVFLGLVTI
jgi:hypothetical protein